MRIIKKGSIDQSIYFEVLDSTSTTGGRKTGLTFGTSNLTAYFCRNQASPVAISLITLAAANSAHADGGFKEVDATNMQGLYRLDLPDAACAIGAESVVVTLRGATGMAQVSNLIQLVDNTALDVYTLVDTEVAAIKAKTDNLPADTASDLSTLATSVDNLPTNAELATALAAADDAVLAQIALVKAVTDEINFGASGAVDANITHVNEIVVNGNGAGTPWGP